MDIPTFGVSATTSLVVYTVAPYPLDRRDDPFDRLLFISGCVVSLLSLNLRNDTSIADGIVGTSTSFIVYFTDHCRFVVIVVRRYWLNRRRRSAKRLCRCC